MNISLAACSTTIKQKSCGPVQDPQLYIQIKLLLSNHKYSVAEHEFTILPEIAEEQVIG
jgi:hypothetical protein